MAPIIPTYYKSKGTPIYRDTTSLPFEEGGKMEIINTYKDIPGVNVNKLNQYLDLGVDQPQTTKQAILLAEAVGYTPEQAKVVGAQWAVESGRGVSQAGTYNYFGIKSHNQNVMDRMSKKYGIAVSESDAKSTKEVIDGKTITIQNKFANFNNPIEGFLGHKAFLETNKRYKNALNPELSADEFARGLQTAGYATDPTYANKLKKVYAGKMRDTRPDWMKPTKKVGEFKMSTVRPVGDSRITQEVNLPETSVSDLGPNVFPLQITPMQPIEMEMPESTDVITVQEGAFYNEPRSKKEAKQAAEIQKFIEQSVQKDAPKEYFGSGQSLFYPSTNAYGGKIYRGGGYTVTRSNNRKGKTHKVVRNSDGKTEYYGHPMKNQPKNAKTKKAAEARHRAQGNFQNPFFKAYWDATWKYGGGMKKRMYENGGPGEPEKILTPGTMEEYEQNPAVIRNKQLREQYEAQLEDFQQQQLQAQQQQEAYQAAQEEYLKNKAIYDTQIAARKINPAAYPTQFEGPGRGGLIDTWAKQTEITDPKLIAEFNRRQAAELAKGNTEETYVPVSRLFRPTTNIIDGEEKPISDIEWLRGPSQSFGAIYNKPTQPIAPTAPEAFTATAPTEPEYMIEPSRPIEISKLPVTAVQPLSPRGDSEMVGLRETAPVYTMKRSLGKGPGFFPKMYKTFEETGEKQYVTPGEMVNYVRPKELVQTPKQEFPMVFPLGMNASPIINNRAGGSINLDPAKKGTFKAQATRMGLSVQEAANKILNAPEGTYSAAMRRKANFAKNFAK